MTQLLELTEPLCVVSCWTDSSTTSLHRQQRFASEIGQKMMLIGELNDFKPSSFRLSLQAGEVHMRCEILVPRLSEEVVATLIL